MDQQQQQSTALYNDDATAKLCSLFDERRERVNDAMFSFEHVKELVLKHKANPNGNPEVKGQTLLQTICACKNSRQIEKDLEDDLRLSFQFLTRQPNISLDHLDTSGLSILHNVIFIAEDSTYLHILLKAFSSHNIDILSDNGKSALLFACSQEHGIPQENVIYLLKAGANPNFLHSESFLTPLMQAVIANRGSRLKCLLMLLLEYGADPNYQDFRGYTALHYAIRNNHCYEVCDLLIQAGSDIHIKNSEGYSPNDFAKTYRNKNALAAIREHTETMQRLVFAQVLHSRLGQNSLARRFLHKDVVRSICDKI